MPRKAKQAAEAPVVPVEEKPIVVEVAAPAKPEKKKRKAGPDARERMLHARALMAEGKTKSEALKAAWVKYPSKKNQSS